MKKNPVAIIYVLFCIALWALIPVVAKLGQVRLNHHQFLFWSSLISFGVLFIATALKGKITEYLTYSPMDWSVILFLGLLGTYIYYLFLYFGYANGRGLEVLVIQYTWPFFIVLFSVPILKEKITLHKGVSVMLGFLGVTIVITKGDLSRFVVEDNFVVLMVSLGATCAALFSVLSKKINKDALAVTTLYFLSATLASFISMVMFTDFTWPTSDALLPIIVNGIGVNGFSYVFWIAALKKAEASFLAPFIFLTPVLSALYLIFFFKEPFIAAHGIGLVLVVIAGMINR